MHILKNGTFWSAISAIAAVITVSVAVYSIKITISERKEERESRRAYFTILKPGMKQLPQSPPYRIQITFENVGSNPSTGLEGKIYFIDSLLQSKPDSTVIISVANDIPPNIPTPWYYDNLTLPENMPKKYIVALINYWDPILKKRFPQKFFMKWDGVEKGVTHSDFTHVSADEKESIENYLKNSKLF